MSRNIKVVFNIKWCCWYCRNDNSGNAKSSNCMGNATWKNDCKYFRKWIIDSYGFIPCSFIYGLYILLTEKND